MLIAIMTCSVRRLVRIALVMGDVRIAVELPL
jgi:hypothetical protein